MPTDATEYYPYDAGAGANVTEAQYRKMTGLTNPNGVVAGYLNELAVTGDSSGMQVKLATGGCWINGAYGENSTTVQTLSIAASHATLNRYDLIVARNNYTTNKIEWDVITGTPGASPTIPTVTTNTTQHEIALAYVYIGATVTTITAANVTDQRPYHNQNNRFYRTTTLSSAADTITVDNLPARRNIRISYSLVPSGAITGVLRFNGDAGNNYSHNTSTNGAASVLTTNTSSIVADVDGTSTLKHGNFSVVNISTSAKIATGHVVTESAAGAGTAPSQRIITGKWNNTSNPITSVSIVNTAAGDFAANSEVTVEGWD